MLTTIDLTVYLHFCEMQNTHQSFCNVFIPSHRHNGQLKWIDDLRYLSVQMLSTFLLEALFAK